MNKSDSMQSLCIVWGPEPLRTTSHTRVHYVLNYSIWLLFLSKESQMKGVPTVLGSLNKKILSVEYASNPPCAFLLPPNTCHSLFLAHTVPSSWVALPQIGYVASSHHSSPGSKSPLQTITVHKNYSEHNVSCRGTKLCSKVRFRLLFLKCFPVIPSILLAF